MNMTAKGKSQCFLSFIDLSELQACELFDFFFQPFILFHEGFRIGRQRGASASSTPCLRDYRTFTGFLLEVFYHLSCLGVGKTHSLRSREQTSCLLDMFQELQCPGTKELIFIYYCQFYCYLHDCFPKTIRSITWQDQYVN